MKSKTKSKTITSNQVLLSEEKSIKSNVFAADPSRMIEWLGPVTHNHLANTLSSIKSFMVESKEGEIQLMINSPGGATGIGMSFYDAMTGWLKPNLTTIGTGDVDSSGIIVFLSGKNRYLTKNTTLLFHLAGRTFGTEKRFSTKDLEDMLKEDRLKDYQYACVVSNATEGKYSPEKVLEMMRETTVLTAEEAVNMGLAHKVLD